MEDQSFLERSPQAHQSGVLHQSLSRHSQPTSEVRMAATNLLTKASSHSARAFAPRLTSSIGVTTSASSGFSSARSQQTSHLLQNQRLGRQSVATSALPSWVPFLGKQRKQVSTQHAHAGSVLASRHSPDSSCFCLELAAGPVLPPLQHVCIACCSM